MDTGKKFKCRNCATIVQSIHRHDWSPCQCYIATLELAKHYATDYLNKLKHLNVTVSNEDEHRIRGLFQNTHLRGFFVDGGGAYLRCGGKLEDMEEYHG